MGHIRDLPLWAEATRNVWRTGWPVLLPVTVAVLGPATGAEGLFARTAPVLVVVAGSALLTPLRFAAVCLTTLVCAVIVSGTGVLQISALAVEGVVTLPLVAAGRAVWVSRTRSKSRRLSVESRLAVTSLRGR